MGKDINEDLEDIKGDGDGVVDDEVKKITIEDLEGVGDGEDEIERDTKKGIEDVESDDDDGDDDDDGVHNKVKRVTNEDLKGNDEDDNDEDVESHQSNDDEKEPEQKQLLSIKDKKGSVDKQQKEIIANEVSFEEFIVETCCSSLYPTDKVIAKLGDAATWRRVANVIVTVITKMQLQQPKSFHFLRVCEDFAKVVYFQDETKPYFLYCLGGLGKQDDDFWNSKDVFENIIDLVENQEDNEKENGGKIDEMLIHFFLRCVNANPDSPFLGHIMKKLCSFAEKEALKFASPILYRILMAEESETFEDVLKDADAIKDYPNLCAIDEALNSVTTETLPLDSHFSVMCSDIIGQVAFEELCLHSVTKSEDRVVQRMHAAVSTVNNLGSITKTGRFRFLVAVAYIRAFLGALATEVLRDSSCLQRDGDLSMLLRNVSAILDTPTLEKCSNPRKVICTLFLLRELRKSLSMFELQKLCESATIIPVLNSIPWLKQDSPITLTSSKNKDVEKAKTAFVNLVKHGKKDALLKFFGTLESSASQRKYFVYALLETFYLPRATRSLGDTEDKAVEIVMKNLPNLSLPFKRLVRCGSGTDDFVAPGLKLTPQSPAGAVHKASLILHITSLLTAEFTTSDTMGCPFLSLIQKPENCEDLFVPGVPDSHAAKSKNSFHFCDLGLIEGASLFQCTCAVRYATTSHECSCPLCKSKCVPVEEGETHVSQMPNKGYVPLHISQITNSSFCVRHMTPVSFRVLRVFVHSALYSGVALNLTNASQLADFLTLDKSMDDPAQECFLLIVNDLEVLCHLLSWSEEEVITWLHDVIEVTAQQLTQCKRSTFSLTNQARDQWEIDFTETVETMLRDYKKRTIKETGNRKSIEDWIEEKDDWIEITNITERNLYLPRLFRSTKPKCLENLKAQYYLATEEQKRRHPLLGLFLDNLTTLSYVSELFPLVNWTRMLENFLSHRLSRDNAEKITIDKVINGQIGSDDVTDSVRNRLKNAFKKFKESWQNARRLVEDELGQAENVPYLNELSPVSMCLVDSKKSGRYLYIALKILQRMHNEFQEKVLRLGATSDCAALDFLKRSDDVSWLPVIRLQDAREKEVISYQWTDDILFHSYHDTEYGRGKEIIYDFGKIEKELAGRFLLEKVYFSTKDDLREFTYSKDLFHTCADVLNELGEYVRQEPLDDILQSGLDRLKKGSLKNVQDLLEHLEVVVCLLKTTGASNNTIPLEDYTDRWLSSSRPFPKELLPEPSKEFQLRHVVALYEGLEDLLAEAAADTIRDKYRMGLTQDSKVITACGDPKEEAAIGAVVTALRRFIFRYLLSDKFQLDPSQNATGHFKDPSLWPMETDARSANNCDESSNIFTERAQKYLPPKLIVGCVYALMKHYCNIIKTQEERRSQARSVGARRTGAGLRPQKKRKIAVSFG